MDLKDDLNAIPHSATVAIYGMGSSGAAMLAWLRVCRPDVAVRGFLDSFRSGLAWDLPVWHFKGNIPAGCNFIVIASSYHRAISETLQQAGITAFAAFATPSYLMGNILQDPEETRNQARSKLATCLSPSPFEHGPESSDCLHLFFGEYGGKFTGNNKYFYLDLLPRLPGRVFWVCEQDTTLQLLQAAQLPVVDFRDASTLPLLKRAACSYFDNMTWQRSHPWLRYLPGKKIHMSHGVGLKLTEIMMVPNDFMLALNPQQKAWFFENIMQNDLLLSSSNFYAREVSEPAYGTPMDRISLAGYPKNDLFYRDFRGAEVGADPKALAHIAAARKRGKKVLFYTPTFRDMDQQFQSARGMDLDELQPFLEQHHMLLVTKGHANSGIDSQPRQSDDTLLFYDNGADVYPALRFADLLITDYSSIFMDFLHADKPILFFPFDYDTYTDLHRQLQFDYNDMTPGPKVMEVSALKEWILRFLVAKEDPYQTRRQEIKDLAWLHQDGHACDRLWQELRHESGLIN